MARNENCRCDSRFTCGYCLRNAGPTVEDFNYQPSEALRKKVREYEAEGTVKFNSQTTCTECANPHARTNDQGICENCHNELVAQGEI